MGCEVITRGRSIFLRPFFRQSRPARANRVKVVTSIITTASSKGPKIVGELFIPLAIGAPASCERINQRRFAEISCQSDQARTERARHVLQSKVMIHGLHKTSAMVQLRVRD